MKIAIVSATYPPYLGGTGNVCAAHARELVRLGYEVQIFTTGVRDNSAELSSNPIVHRLRPLLQVGNAKLLPQLAWRLRGFDIIHWHYPFFGGELVALAAILTRTPLIVTYHQDVLLNGWPGRVANLLESTVSKWALLSAEKILFTSDDYAQHSKFRSVLPPARIATLSNGVDVDRFSVPAQATKNVTFTALLVAGLDAAHYFKGVSIFLQAIAQTDGINAVIVGDGGLRSTYEAEAARLGIDQRVQFAGRVSEAALPHCYQSADVTVLPSTTMGEAFGLVLVESLACGTPVIASNLPGVRSVVSDAVDGYLVEPDNTEQLSKKLAFLRDLSPDQRSRLGQAGRNKVEQKYQWATIGQQLHALIQTQVMT